MSYRSRHCLYGWRKARRAGLAASKQARAYNALLHAVAEHTKAHWDYLVAHPRPSFFQRLKEQEAKESGAPKP